MRSTRSTSRGGNDRGSRRRVTTDALQGALTRPTRLRRGDGSNVGSSYTEVDSDDDEEVNEEGEREGQREGEREGCER